MSVVFLGLSVFRSYQIALSFVADGDGGPTGGFWPDVFWLALHLALPLHLTFVALLLQRKYVRPGVDRFAWFGAIVSGCWLGISFIIRKFH